MHLKIIQLRRFQLKHYSSNIEYSIVTFDSEVIVSLSFVQNYFNISHQ